MLALDRIALRGPYTVMEPVRLILIVSTLYAVRTRTGGPLSNRGDGLALGHDGDRAFAEFLADSTPRGRRELSAHSRARRRSDGAKPEFKIGGI